MTGVIADYNQAIRLDPENAAAYFNRRVAYHAKGDNDRAIAEARTNSLSFSARLDEKKPDYQQWRFRDGQCAAIPSAT